LSQAQEKQQKKQYVYPHKHCIYCGRMIEVRGREYCLKCKPEHEKELSKIGRSKKFRKFLVIYVAIVAIAILAVLAYSFLGA